MNANIGKYAKWYVRVMDPRIISYTFISKGETVFAEKFECVLVSKDPAQYMLATVPFSFTDRLSATKALDAFKNNDVLQITTPAFDAKARPEFNGCPVKSVLLLTKPTTIKHVPCTNTEMLQHPAQGLEVSLQITALVEHLRNSGSAKSFSKTFDVCGKFLFISGKHGEQREMPYGAGCNICRCGG